MDLRHTAEMEMIGLDDGREGKNAFRSWSLEVWVRDLNLKDFSTNYKKSLEIICLTNKRAHRVPAPGIHR